MKKIKEDDFDCIYQIMVEAFPEIERRSYEDQKALLKLAQYDIYKEEIDGDIIAFMGIWEFEHFAFIEHFACNHKVRGKGIGKICLEYMMNKLEKDIILEVEMPFTDIAIRRIHFYERVGFKLNTYEYVQPPLQVGFQPYPLHIMSYPDELNYTRFKEVKKELYAYVYGIKNDAQ